MNETAIGLDNPARLSPLLAGLFPPGVFAAELRHAGEPALLMPLEAMHVVWASAKRAQEFSAGRLCARRALVEVGIFDTPLPMKNNRCPQWPALTTGSITHTSRFCGAVVARDRNIAALGLDAEVIEEVGPEIWPLLCTAEEARRLAGLPHPLRLKLAALMFSAKEAFYKCQYTLTGETLEFHDVVLDLGPAALSEGEFAIRVLKPDCALYDDPRPLIGRFTFDGPYVMSGMTIFQHRVR